MSTETPQQKFDRWLREYRGLMLKVVHAFTPDRSDQEDLLQEIAVALWRSIQQFRLDSHESTWIYKVALYTATTWSRGEIRRNKHATIAPDDPSDRPMQASDPRQEWLLETIRGLPVDDSTLLLTYLDGYSHTEIAELTGMSVANVGVRLHRLKKRLTQEASEHFDDI